MKAFEEIFDDFSRDFDGLINQTMHELQTAYGIENANLDLKLDKDGLYNRIEDFISLQRKGTKILLASDFYYEWMLLEVFDVARFKELLPEFLEGKEADQQAFVYRVICDDESMPLEEAKAEAVETIWMSNYIREE